MTTSTPHGAPELPGLTLARLFHETYERLAPQFGYTTRPETREFDPESANGKLMTAVCAAIQQAAGAVPEGYAQRVIDELYENGDPVSVDAAELLTQMLAASPSSPVQPDSGHLGAGGSQDHLVPCAGDRVPLRGEQIYEIFAKALPKATGGMSFVPEWAVPVARAIEAAHGIDPGSATREDGDG